MESKRGGANLSQLEREECQKPQRRRQFFGSHGGASTRVLVLWMRSHGPLSLRAATVLASPENPDVFLCMIPVWS